MGKISDMFGGRTPFGDVAGPVRQGEETVGPPTPEVIPEPPPTPEQQMDDITRQSMVLRSLRDFSNFAYGLTDAVPGASALQAAAFSPGTLGKVTGASPDQASKMSRQLKHYMSQPNTAVGEAAKFIGEMVGYAGTGSAAARAVSPFVPKAAVGATSWLSRYKARIPFVLAEGTAFQVGSTTKAAVEGTPLFHDIPFNYAVPLAFEGVLTKAFKTHGRELGRVNVSYNVKKAVSKDDPFELAHRAEVSMGEHLADYPNLDDFGLKEVASQKAASYPEQMTQQLIKDNASEYWQGMRTLSKPVVDGLMRARKRLSNTATIFTPQENVPLLQRIGATAEALGLMARENSTIAYAKVQAGLERLRIEFTLPNGKLDTDALAQVRMHVEDPLRKIEDPRIQKFVDFWSALRKGISADMENLGMKAYDHRTRSFVDYAPKENYFPNLHNFHELDRLMRLGDPNDPAIKEITERLLATVDEKTAQWLLPQSPSQKWNYVVAKQRMNKVKWLQTSFDMPGGSYDPFETISRYSRDMLAEVERHRVLGQTIPISELEGHFGDMTRHLLPSDPASLGLSDLIPDGTTQMSIHELLGQAVENLGGSRPEFDKAMNVILGKTENNVVAERISSLLRGVSAVKWLPLSAISQMGGLISSVTDSGSRRNGQALLETMTKEGKDYAQRAGALSHDVATMLDSTDSGSVVGKFLKKVGASKMDYVIRTISALAGKRYVAEIVEKAAVNGVETLNKDEHAFIKRIAVPLEDMVEYYKNSQVVGPGGKRQLFDEDIMARIGFRSQASNQFLSDPLENPVFSNSAWGKVLMQMRQFAYQAAIFVKERVWDEAVQNKNFRPLGRILVAAPLVGEFVGDLKDLARLRDPTQRGEQGSVVLGRSIIDPLRNMGINITPGSWGEMLANRAIDNVLLGGALGMWMDTVDVLDESKTPRVLFGPGYATTTWAMDTAKRASGEIIDYLRKGISPASVVSQPGIPTLPKVVEAGVTAAAAIGVPGSPLASAALPALETLFMPSRAQVDRTFPGLKTPEGKLQTQVRRANLEKGKVDKRIKAALEAGDYRLANQTREVYNRWAASTVLPKITTAAIDAKYNPKDVFKQVGRFDISVKELFARAKDTLIEVERKKRMEDTMRSFIP